MGKNKLKENELQSGQIGLALVDSMQEITLSKIGDEGINNAHKNLKFLDEGLSLKEMRNAPLGEGDQAAG